MPKVQVTKVNISKFKQIVGIYSIIHFLVESRLHYLFIRAKKNENWRKYEIFKTCSNNNSCINY